MELLHNFLKNPPRLCTHCLQDTTDLEVPWWWSKLRIQHCHCCGSGHSGAGLISGPETSACLGHSQKEKGKKERKKDTSAFLELGKTKKNTPPKVPLQPREELTGLLRPPARMITEAHSERKKLR